MHLRMSLAKNRTQELWQAFMKRQREISRWKKGEKLYSLQQYPPGYFRDFDPHNHFEKWAAIEIAPGTEGKPEDMDTLTIPGGLYAVFVYKGHPAQAPGFFRYIFGEWLPQSAFTLDHRPHFEVLDERYNNDSADSEEDIWIPVKAKEKA